MIFEAFRLISDLSMYYAVILCMMELLTKSRPFVLFYIFAWVMIWLDTFRRIRKPRPALLVYAICAIPLISFLFHPDLIQMISVMPIWVWLSYAMITGRFDQSYEQYKSQAKKVVLIMFLMLLAYFWVPGFMTAFIHAVPFIAISLAVAVCTLRYLRQERTGALRNAVYISGVTLGCLIAAATNLFNVIWNLFCRAYLWAVNLLFSIPSSSVFEPFVNDLELPEAVLPQLGEFTDESIHIESVNVLAQTQEQTLLEKILIIAAMTILISFITWLFLSSKNSVMVRREKKDEEQEKIVRRKKARLPLFAPSQPREAVRYYYAKYMRECRRQAILIEPSMTAGEISEASAVLLDEENREAMRDLYIRSRYSSQDISTHDAETAKQIYRQLKNSRQ